VIDGVVEAVIDGVVEETPTEDGNVEIGNQTIEIPVNDPVEEM